MTDTEISSDTQETTPSEQEIIAWMKSLELGAKQIWVYLTRNNLEKVALELLSWKENPNK